MDEQDSVSEGIVGLLYVYRAGMRMLQVVRSHLHDFQLRGKS